MNRKKIILDCDPGMDDSMAIVMAAKSSALELLAVTTVSGNYPVDVTSLNARKVLELLGRDDIPVAKGQMLLADMIGLPVIDANTEEVYGEITEVNDVPRGLLYTVKTAKGDVYYPSGKEFIKEIDEERGMFITPIPGFFD
jgi:hypothetical protein